MKRKVESLKKSQAVEMSLVKQLKKQIKDCEAKFQEAEAQRLQSTSGLEAHKQN